MDEDFKILNHLKEQNKNNRGFNVPDDYFASFDDKMMDIITAEEQTLAKKIVLVLKPWLSMAAIFTVIAIVYYNTPYFKTGNTVADASITNEITLDFLSSDFDELELIDIITDDSNTAIFENMNTDPALLEGITYDDIEGLVIF